MERFDESDAFNWEDLFRPRITAKRVSRLFFEYGFNGRERSLIVRRYIRNGK